MHLTHEQQNKKQRLFLVLGAFFIANAIVAEFIGTKIFSVERTLGFGPLNLSIFGLDNQNLNMTCGVLLWPAVFIMTDIINEYFGQKGVRFFSYLGAILIAYAFVGVFLAMKTTPADWWIMQQNNGEIINMDKAYNAVFGQGLLIIVASITAFLLGQLVDVYLFHAIKKRTGHKHMWLRSTGSTIVSQLIDTFVVLGIAFYLPGKMTGQQFIVTALVSYTYKFLVAFAVTPLLYAIHNVVDRYLGKDLSDHLQHVAMAHKAI
ncbi:MAG: queuosine precursor transporter [Bacteroidetes bacterium]|nr:queuosine precursor transporter [Bacteroidota bacterium]